MKITVRRTETVNKHGHRLMCVRSMFCANGSSERVFLSEVVVTRDYYKYT